MAYSKTNWVNENEPAINADNLNKIEAGIEDNSLQLESYGRTINEIINNKVETNAIKNEASTEVDEIYSSNYLNDKLVSVGSTAPVNGERVWFKKSKNLFNINGGTAEGTQNVSIVIEGNTIKQTNQGNYARSAWEIQGLETNKQYTLSLNFTNINASSLNARVYKSDGSTLITQSNATTNTSGEIELTFTAIEKIVYIRFYSNTSQTGNTYEVDFSNIQLEQGSTATTYEPYADQGICVDEEEWYSKPKVLYENSTGATTGTITLNDRVANYSCVDVVFSIDSFSENTRNYIRLEKYNSTQIFGGLITGQVDGSGNLRVWATRITITGTTATLDRDICLSLNTSGISSQTSRIKVLKILGYKE